MKIVSLLFATVVLCSTASAMPVLFCKDGPGIDLVGDGCISGISSKYPGGGDGVFSNAGGGDPEAAVEAAILGATGVAVDITKYGKTDDNPGLFSSISGFTGVQSGDWSVIDGTKISYVTIVAANSFALYQLIAPASSGSFSTLGILTNGGSRPTVSHISFWTAPPALEVPEPATALLGLIGLGMASRLKRR